MGLIRYATLSKAQEQNPLKTEAEYLRQRQNIYNSLKDSKKVEDFFNQQNLNLLTKKHKELKDFVKSLDTLRVTTTSETNNIFTGESVSDTEQIKKLIKKAKSLQGVENFNDYTKIFNELENSADFVNKELRSKLSSNNLFSIGTKDYELMKKAIEEAKKENNIKKAQENAKKYYSGLIGNLGESIGIIQSYNTIQSKIPSELKKIGVVGVEISNTGGQSSISGKRKVGDTTVEFKYANGEILGKISFSNKLTASYGKSKSTKIKFRETSPNQIQDERVKKLFYNLYSFHADGENKNAELYGQERKKDIIAFRRYLASLIVKENLFGVGSDDNVYYFNYGEYIYTMNDLLTYWNSNTTQTSGIPLASFPGYSIRLNSLKGVKNPLEAEKIIDKYRLIINYSFHIGNMNAALGIS